MSYDPHHGRNPYAPQNPDHYRPQGPAPGHPPPHQNGNAYGPAGGAYGRPPHGDPYAQPHGDPYAQPHRDPYAQQHGDPHAQPHGDPYAQQHGDPYAQPNGSPYDQHGGNPYGRPIEEPRERRGDGGSDALANVIHVLTGLIALVFVLHILFVVFGANQGNDFVAFVYGTAKVLVLGLGDVFTPGDAVLGVVLNYGLAALIYFVIGRLISRAIRR